MLLATCSRNHSTCSHHYLHCSCVHRPPHTPACHARLASSTIASWSRVDTLTAFFCVALTLAHAFGRAFFCADWLKLQASPQVILYLPNHCVAGWFVPEWRWLYPVEVQPINYHVSGGNHSSYSLCILLEGVWLAEPLDKVVADCCLISRANCT